MFALFAGAFASPAGYPGSLGPINAGTAAPTTPRFDWLQAYKYCQRIPRLASCRMVTILTVRTRASRSRARLFSWMTTQLPLRSLILKFGNGKRSVAYKYGVELKCSFLFRAASLQQPRANKCNAESSCWRRCVAEKATTCTVFPPIGNRVATF
jgi:hypothetical protein